MKKIWNFIGTAILTIFVVVWVGLLLIVGTFVDPPWRKMK